MRFLRRFLPRLFRRPRPGLSVENRAAIEGLMGLTPTTNHPQSSCQTTEGAGLSPETIEAIKNLVFGLPAETKGQD